MVGPCSILREAVSSAFRGHLRALHMQASETLFSSVLSIHRKDPGLTLAANFDRHAKSDT